MTGGREFPSHITAPVVVVLGEERGAEPVGLADRGEPLREGRAVLQRLAHMETPG